MSNIVVIGAGIVGASTAYQLSKTNHHVTLIDADFIGRATSAAAGIICPWVSQRRNKVWYRLASESACYYPKLINELKEQGISKTGYKQVGTLVVKDDEERLTNILKLVEQRRETTPEIGEVHWLDTAETKQRFPLIADGYFSLYVSGGARVHGEQLRQALLLACQKNNVPFITGEASFVDGEIMVSQRKIEADKVVIAAGAWFNTLVQGLGITGKIKPQKAQITTLQIEADTEDWPVIMPPGAHYMVPFADGRLFAGVTHEDDVGFDTSITPGGLYQIFSDTFTIAPSLAQSKLIETNVGFRPVAPDFLPVFGEFPNHPGIYAANGLGSSGLTTGPFIGKQLAQLVLGEKTDLAVENYPISTILEKG
ncbi:NAD(P)/FAD-dependent oxidoreductase [Gracilibacillus alcaliphilus]|uniref:NAD(P)/FAD-dependent oxidoreductase n=1 Tax=Gracilibacillus alcaliphilus TaxID=1401441 RepID=UPI001956CFA2|nr:FAD-dependent oxidoreductase [Gracilibacillus alcaliphilus]MBM7677790.1 D-amino-acid dehydrogenase [Gracilibacillus alcaliphilus]